MAKVITQATFDDVVQENIVEFSMDPEEAKKETVEQFEAQGINLANIIKDLSINPSTGKPILNESIENIKQYIGEKSTNSEKLLEYLTILNDECAKSIPHRVLAGKNEAHNAVVTLLEQEIAKGGSELNKQVVSKCLEAANSLTKQQPDIFDAEALSIILQLLGIDQLEEDILCLALQWLQKACVMHEMNRQNIVSSNLLSQLKPYVNKEASIQVMRELSVVLRFLVLDDDIRVEFGHAHEHARQIAAEYIVDLTKLLGEYSDIGVLSDLLLTIGSLAVRQEFCTTIEEAGGLKLVFEIMSSNLNAVRVNREALKLLRALAGNDGVKVHIVQQGGAPIIKEVLQTHHDNENLAIAALGCISTLTLRVKENSIAFFETGIAEIIVEAMRQHGKSKLVQRNGAWAIRNMVSRSRDQCDTWLSFGVEDLLNCAMSEHPSVQQDVKAALRDLGCKVDLKEEWTGTAEKKITNDYNQIN